MNEWLAYIWLAVTLIQFSLLNLCMLLLHECKFTLEVQTVFQSARAMPCRRFKLATSGLGLKWSDMVATRVSISLTVLNSATLALPPLAVPLPADRVFHREV